MLSRLGYARELAALQMTDTCIILTRQGGTRDSYGYKNANYSAQAPIACSYDPANTGEVAVSTTQVAVSSATVYVALGTPVRTADRLKVTHLNGDGTPESGEQLAVPLVFQVIGQPELQPSVIAVKVATLVDTGGSG